MSPQMRIGLRPTAFALAACSESTTAPEAEVELPPDVVLVRATEVTGFDTTQYTVTCRAKLHGASACPTSAGTAATMLGSPTGTTASR